MLALLENSSSIFSNNFFSVDASKEIMDSSNINISESLSADLTIFTKAIPKEY